MNWYAVNTRSNFEKKVAVELHHGGVESYCPVLRRASRRKDRKQEVDVPLFPGYLFVRLLDAPAARRKVLHTTGVVSILGSTGVMEPVPEAEIQGVRRLLDSAIDCAAHPLIREGAYVRVSRGPLKGFEGLLTEVRKRSRIAISVDLLGQSVSAEIDVRDVEFISHGMAR